MPVVQNCSVSECAYNAGNACHAKAITIGDNGNPRCDTYLCISTPAPANHMSNSLPTAGVGACKVDACTHNTDYECTADAISVGHENDLIKCLSYAHR